ncbi:MAG: Uma2 family endonuclease [Anaerolineae bacterium]|nr:Uma2 family endonuclease [Anaerolineae bacterium]
MMTELQTTGERLAAPARLSYEDFLKAYDGCHAEWVDGEVMLMAPISVRHVQVAQFLTYLIGHFLSSRPVGELFTAPMQFRLGPDLPGREPDLAVVLEANLARVKTGYVDGPPDLAVEIVLEESAGRDRGVKYVEYEKASVLEYWLIDPLRAEALFYRLGEDGRFRRMPADNDTFASDILPGLTLQVSVLWQDRLPNAAQTAERVAQMLGAH